MKDLDKILDEAVDEVIEEIDVDKVVDEVLDNGDTEMNNEEIRSICSESSPCYSKERERINKVSEEILDILQENHVSLCEFGRIVDEIRYKAEKLFTL